MRQRFTPAQIERIRTDYATTQLSAAEVAAKHGSSPSAVQAIAAGECHADCGGPITPRRRKAKPEPAPSSPSINVLSIVTLASGGPAMTVVHAIPNRAQVRCRWFDAGGHVQTGEFDLAFLKLVQS